MKKYCTYSPTFPQTVTYFLLNTVTVYDSYFVDKMSFALPNYKKKKRNERKGMGCSLITWLVYFVGVKQLISAMHPY